MVGTADVERGLEQLEERQVTAFGVGHQEAAPGGKAPGPDPAQRDGLLQGLDGFDQRAPKVVGPLRGELELGILDAVDVDRLQPQVAAAALDLVLEERAVHAVLAVHQRVRVDQARVDVGRVQVALRLAPRAREIGVDRQVAALADHADLVALHAPFGDRPPQGRAQRPLAGLRAIGERGVEHVDTALERAADGGAIGQVVDAADRTHARAQPQRRQREQVGAPEVARQGGEAPRVAARALCGGRPRE